MRTAIFLGLIALLLGVFADDFSKEKVKAAFVDGLKQIHASPRRIEAYEKGWDGSLPDTLGGLATMLRKMDLTEQEVQSSVDGIANVAKNKDNPSWKTLYGNMYIKLGGADKAIVERLEENAPDTIPTDLSTAKEVLKKVGIPEEHAQAHAQMVVWLGKVHA